MRTLEITSYIGCPVKCEYCPQDILLKNYEGKERMELSDMEKILSNTPKDVRIDFSGFSEIFGHIKGSWFILLAYGLGYEVVLYTTLVGIKDIDFRILKDVKFTDLCFHQYPKAGLQFFDKVRKFETRIHTGRVAEITTQWRWSRAGNVWPMPHKSGTFHCIFAEKNFDHNVVLPNGDVYLCCQDYSLKHKIGNLYTTKFDDLDRSDIRNCSNMEESECICRNCEIAQYD
jgi:radical SAM protein with 4Fe4S-binding SPASM domain